jgi:hypothetical protein
MHTRLPTTDIGDRGTHPSHEIRKHLDDHAVGCQPRMAARVEFL